MFAASSGVPSWNATAPAVSVSVSNVSHPVSDKAYSTSSTMTEFTCNCMTAAQSTVPVSDQLFGFASLMSTFAMLMPPPLSEPLLFRGT